MRPFPHPRACFFEQAIFQGERRDARLQRPRLLTEFLDFSPIGMAFEGWF